MNRLYNVIKWGAVGSLYSLIGLATGYATLIVTSISNQPSGEPDWPLAVLCGACWPATWLWVAWIVVQANL